MRGWIVFPHTGSKQSSFFEHFNSFFTGGNWNGFGHVELWIEIDGVLYRATATPSLGTIGPMLEKAKNDGNGKPLVLGSKDYTFLKLPDDFNFTKLLEVLKPELGCGYDWLGVARYVLPFLNQSKNRWYCSEIVSYLLTVDTRFSSLNDRKFQYSPNALYRATKSWLETDFV